MCCRWSPTCYYLLLDISLWRCRSPYSVPSGSPHSWSTGSPLTGTSRSARSCRRPAPSCGHISHNCTLKNTRKLTKYRTTKGDRCPETLIKVMVKKMSRRKTGSAQNLLICNWNFIYNFWGQKNKGERHQCENNKKRAPFLLVPPSLFVLVGFELTWVKPGACTSNLVLPSIQKEVHMANRDGDAKIWYRRKLSAICCYVALQTKFQV